ncbi:putative cystathionine gamma-synthase [Podospora fimiseda]|uniref:Cystathionine gamma-synthase n=1 Tax=Podospora fimiseda TaxID=252190 RepID=A0AAN7H1A6_9PEZI|nr:putative cystathionine gamma-synthase [Podospora fimiseda]
MPVKVITTELGHSMPPEAPHNITFYIPGWETAKALRRGDPTLLSKLSSIYPRFGPWCEVKQLAGFIHKSLGFPENYGAVLFVNPDCFDTAKIYSSAKGFRKEEHLVEPKELKFRVVDFGDDEEEVVRLFVIGFPLSKGPGVVGTWQTYGCGISSRLAEWCLGKKETLTILEWEGNGEQGGLENVPEGRFLKETEAHEGLKERIVELVKRGARDEELAGRVEKDDVWVYPTGMGAIWRLHKGLIGARGGKGRVIILGSVFQNTWGLAKESEGGMKHFGRVDGESGMIERLEEWLEEEEGKKDGVSYVLTEFPSNPILESVNLQRLRVLADKYNFPVVVDDTIGSFANIDVLPEVDVIVTSITKSLSGYANVMGGSIVLAPHSPFYTDLKSTIKSQFRNEFYAADAAKLLANSENYLPRSKILNRNALTVAKFFDSQASLPSSPVTATLYPPYSKTHEYYKAAMRKPTEEFPNPGYGCLLAVDFESMATARAFYDNLSFYHGPHLGAHLTLAFPFNDAIWGTEPGAPEYLKTFGANPEQVRISIGLESEEELLDTIKYALEKAEEAKRGAEA